MIVKGTKVTILYGKHAGHSGTVIRSTGGPYGLEYIVRFNSGRGSTHYSPNWIMPRNDYIIIIGSERNRRSQEQIKRLK